MYQVIKNYGNNELLHHSFNELAGKTRNTIKKHRHSKCFENAWSGDVLFYDIQFS